ncbi:MAG TPA: DUF2252 family protein, partial [Nitrospira sp.]|nr:DUF2252 family protein [Nitrospira sp.]
MKGSATFDPTRTSLKGFREYCKLCGWALALAHAKSGDPAAIAGYLGKNESMDEAIARFAAAYAKQTDRDHDALVKAARAKRVRAANVA